VATRATALLWRRERSSGTWPSLPAPDPHDWLAQHPELGQTFDQFLHTPHPVPVVAEPGSICFLSASGSAGRRVWKLNRLRSSRRFARRQSEWSSQASRFLSATKSRGSCQVSGNSAGLAFRLHTKPVNRSSTTTPRGAKRGIRPGHGRYRCHSTIAASSGIAASAWLGRIRGVKSPAERSVSTVTV
jgi:hypothetical protein